VGDSYVSIYSYYEGQFLAFHNTYGNEKKYEKYKTLIWTEAWNNIQQDLLTKEFMRSYDLFFKHTDRFEVFGIGNK
jgi:hypothetical protein